MHACIIHVPFTRRKTIKERANLSSVRHNLLHFLWVLKVTPLLFSDTRIFPPSNNLNDEIEIK